LVAAPEGRPSQPKTEALGRLGHRKEQPTDLRHGQGEEGVCRSPPLPASTVERVTSR
jgi:hypothetical protein